MSRRVGQPIRRIDMALHWYAEQLYQVAVDNPHLKWSEVAEKVGFERPKKSWTYEDHHIVFVKDWSSNITNAVTQYCLRHGLKYPYRQTAKGRRKHKMSYKKVYIAHPLAGDGTQEWGNMERNVERYLRFAALASNNGYVVLSWVHHYLMHSRGLTTGDASYYLSRDKELLRLADEVWLCCPAGVSEGCDQEERWAVELEIPVVRQFNWTDPAYWPNENSVMS